MIQIHLFGVLYYTVVKQISFKVMLLIKLSSATVSHGERFKEGKIGPLLIRRSYSGDITTIPASEKMLVSCAKTEYEVETYSLRPAA